MEDCIPIANDIFEPCDDDEPISVSLDQVAAKLKQISVSRASGPINLPNWVLKTYSDILAPALTEVLISALKNPRFHESGSWLMFRLCKRGNLFTYLSHQRFLKSRRLRY